MHRNFFYWMATLLAGVNPAVEIIGQLEATKFDFHRRFIIQRGHEHTRTWN